MTMLSNHMMSSVKMDESKENNQASFSAGICSLASRSLEFDPAVMWIVDSGDTDHVAHDRSTFVEFRLLSTDSRRIYVGDGSYVEVKGIGTCQLELRDGRILYLHDVLYAPRY